MPTINMSISTGLARCIECERKIIKDEKCIKVQASSMNEYNYYHIACAMKRIFPLPINTGEQNG